MAITKNRGRQSPIEAYVDITFADLAGNSGVSLVAIDVPVGAQLVGGDLVVNTAFNSATSDAITVGDITNATRYLGSTTIAALARTPLVPTGFQTTSTQPAVRVAWTGVGAIPTAGSIRLRVAYIQNKRAAFAQG